MRPIVVRSSRGSGEQPRVPPRPSSRVPWQGPISGYRFSAFWLRSRVRPILVYGSPRITAIRSRACYICSQARFRPGGERRSGVLIFFPPD